MDDNTRMRRARQMAPDDRRQHLLAVAMKVFADKGIDAARYEDIAKAAGVSKPTVHSYFKTRQDLVSSILAETYRYIYEEGVRPFISGPTYNDRMTAAGQNFLKRLAADPHYFKLWVMWGAYFGETYAAQHAEYERQSIQHLCQLMAGETGEIDDESLLEKGRVLQGLSLFLCQMALRGESAERQKTFVRNAVRTLRVWL